MKFENILYHNYDVNNSLPIISQCSPTKFVDDFEKKIVIRVLQRYVIFDYNIPKFKTVYKIYVY